jgi:uncharacterized protein (TIGR02246 family)
MQTRYDSARGTTPLLALALALSMVIASYASPSGEVDVSNPDVAAIVQVARDFSEAIAVGDLKRVIEAYSPEVVYMSPGKPDTQGRDALAQSWQAMLSTYNMHVDVRIVEVKILGDYAFDRATFTTSMKPKAGGETQEVSGRVFEVLRKENGKWKSLRVMVNSDN